MPNGGPDNCGYCRFNRARQGVMGAETAEAEIQVDVASYCTLRDVPISNSHWTYCRNFASIHASAPLDAKTPRGPIFKSGGYEAGVGYVRIPWFGKVEPAFGQPVGCWVCGRNVERGITLRVREQTFGFCSNRHYIDWWKIECEDASIDSSRLNTPEEWLKEPPDEDS